MLFAALRVIGSILLVVAQEDYATTTEEIIQCDPPWERVHRACLRFNTTNFRSWTEAREECKTLGADLLVISDASEFDALGKPLKSKITSQLLLKWWVGLELRKENVDEEIRSSWTWVDGTSYIRGLPYWAPGEPNGARSTSAAEDCVVLDYQTKIKDDDCKRSFPYICEQNRVSPKPSTYSPTRTTTSSSTSTVAPAPKRTSSTPTLALTKTAGNVHTTTIGYQRNTSSNNLSNKQTEQPRNKTTETPVSNPTNFPGHATTENPRSTRTDNTGNKHTDNPKNKPTYHPGNNFTENPDNKSTNIAESMELETTTVKSNGMPDNPEKENDLFQGCYSVNYEGTCPPVLAFGISWPRGEADRVVTVPCENGEATWQCSRSLVVCWRGEPNVHQCTSDTIRELTTKMDEFLSDKANAEPAVSFTETLAAVSSAPGAMSQQDLYQSTVLMQAAAQARPGNASQAKAIITNVLKFGNNLMAEDKRAIWSSMEAGNQRTVAASLVRSVENVAMAMLEVYREPGVEKIRVANMGVELHVVAVDHFLPPSTVQYQGDENAFAVPGENLVAFAKDGLAKIVFIEYTNMDELLKPEVTSSGDQFEKRVISHVVSAAIGDKPPGTQLQKPVTFTFKTENRGNGAPYKQQCSFWNFSIGFSGGWSQKGCTLDKYNSTHTTCRCDHMTNFAILMDIHSTKISDVHVMTLSYITYVGIIISVVCCFLSWLTFVCLSCRCVRGYRGSNEDRGNSAGSYYGGSAASRSVQSERNSIHKHLVFTLFVAEILFLAGIERTEPKIACSIIAGFLHFFFLSSFCWMFVEGIHILFMLVQVFDAAKSRIKYYYLLGYGVPTLIVGISALVRYEGYGTPRYCWLTTERWFIWSFAGPVSFILLVNMMILIYAMSAVCKHAEYVFTKEKTPTGNLKIVELPSFVVQMKEHVEQHKAWIQGALALEVLLGLTWVFGYFYISEAALPVAYLFTIFNSLQGLFIFVFHCILNKKVRKEYQRFIDYPRRPNSSGTHSSRANGSGPSHTFHLAAPARKHSGPGFMEISKSADSRRQSSTDA
ncbi:adhesion G protein-coupled receptor L1-like isoform X3 [Dreissena polymorpha]|uniref:adhesion G protein-coupled receptor L1-like isoform X3 n=1 Tax=Dreissena polymorpha TaxID=45954 RepID=UPI0022641402|nr:adhesion G protein-coupled receptor L1-like isoform X3 [Dreissena polymorpha]